MKNLKKRIAAFGIAACLAIGLSACGGSSNTASSGTASTASANVSSLLDSSSSSDGEQSKNSPVGIYKAVEMIAEDVTLSADDIRQGEEYGLAMYIVFSEDGSVQLDIMGDQGTGTWNEKNVTIDGSEVDYSLDGDTLTLTEEDTVITFTRTTQEEIDAILANASESTEGTAGESDTASSSESADSTGSADSTSVSGDAASAAISGDYSTEETSLFDSDEAAMTITGYDTGDSYYGFVVNVRCENKTSDKTLMFSVGSAAIDGYMVLPLFAEEATAGNTINGKINFDRGELETAGITSVDELTLEVNLIDSDTYDTLSGDTVTVYPTGKSADEIVYPERTASDSDSVAVDDDNVSFIITGMTHDDMWEAYDVAVYIENKTDQTLNFSWNNVAVNGSMIDPYWAKEIMPGKKAYAEISFYDTSLEENGITDITSIEYELKVSDAEDWTANALVDEKFTWNP